MNRRVSMFFALVFVLVLAVSSSLADNNGWYTIDAPITSSAKMNASQWYTSAQSRALLTFSVSADTIPNLDNSDSDSFASFLINSSWVAISKSKNQLMVTGYYSSKTSTTVLIMLYTPSTGKIQYMPVTSKPAMSDSNAEMLCMAALSDGSTQKYEKNDLTEILKIISDLQK